MTGKRKRYGADFKAKVALEAIRGELELPRKSGGFPMRRGGPDGTTEADRKSTRLNSSH